MKNLQIPDVMKNDGLYPTERDKKQVSPEEVEEFKKALLNWRDSAIQEGWQLDKSSTDGNNSFRLTLGQWSAHIITRKTYLGIHVFLGNRQIPNVPHFYRWSDLHRQVTVCPRCGK